MEKIKNLFDYATSELSQDAFLCWLFENYNCGEQDCSIVAANMMYEAEELGVHTLWIRGFDAREVAQAFSLPGNHIPVMMLALGYPSANSHPAHLHGKRKELSETVRFL